MKQKKELLTVRETANHPISLYKTENNNSGTVLFQGLTKNIETINNTIGKEPMYISIVYDSVNIYKDNNKNESETSRCGTICHDFCEPFYEDIVDLQIYYHSEIGNRYSLKYVFLIITFSILPYCPQY